MRPPFPHADRLWYLAEEILLTRSVSEIKDQVPASERALVPFDPARRQVDPRVPLLRLRAAHSAAVPPRAWPPHV